MTHACLIVTDGEDLKNNVWLHTYHTGMDTPKWVREAVQLLIKRAMSPLIINREQAARTWESESLSDSWAGTPAYVAALVIAARPGCYVPVPGNDTALLPEWSGKDEPYVLHVRDGKWMLSGGGFEDEPETIDVRREFLNQFPSERVAEQ